MNKIVSTRYKIADKLWCIRFFHLIYYIVLLSAYILIPSEYMPAFCTGKNGISLNLSWSCVGVSISHSMKYLYLSNVLSDFTHLDHD